MSHNTVLHVLFYTNYHPVPPVTKLFLSCCNKKCCFWFVQPEAYITVLSDVKLMCWTVNFGCLYNRKAQREYQNKIVIGSQDGGINEFKGLKHKLQSEMQVYTLINSDQNLVLSHQQKKCVI